MQRTKALGLPARMAYLPPVLETLIRSLGLSEFVAVPGGVRERGVQDVPPASRR